jgi:hypothetical protein
MVSSAENAGDHELRIPWKSGATEFTNPTRYEGKGPLHIDAEIEAARNAALAKRRRLRSA